MPREMLAPCGLDCGPCVLRRLPFDEDAAQESIQWFREMDWLKPEEGVDEAIERGMYCNGCLGDRKPHWSVGKDGAVNCVILRCAVDERGLDSCSFCPDFACDSLLAWSKESSRYAEAFARLQQLRGSVGAGREARD